MTRPRDLAPGLRHIYAHSIRDTALFVDDVDRFDFVNEIVGTTKRYGWTILEVCLMTTHYHLVLETPDTSLAVGMHRLNFRYARRFNERHRLRGHVFEARYGDRRIRDDAHLVSVYRYVARNPVEAGLCETADAWPWSSYSALVRGTESFTFVDASQVVAWFGEGDEAIAELRAYVERAEVLALR